MTKGLPQRLARELEVHYSSKMSDPNNQLHAPANRAVAAWVGGSMLSSIETFQKLSIKRSDYEEGGEVETREALISRRTL